MHNGGIVYDRHCSAPGPFFHQQKYENCQKKTFLLFAIYNWLHYFMDTATTTVTVLYFWELYASQTL